MVYRKKRSKSNGTISIGIIVGAFLVIMCIQIVNLNGKDKSYAQRLEDLRQEYEAQTKRSTEIDELEEYMKSDEYIEETAKNKLGLTYDNEIIFKESED